MTGEDNLNYIVIKSVAGMPMEEVCDILVKDGWVPAGSPFYKPNVNTHTPGDWCQAMWKPLDKEERDGRHI